MLAATLFFGGWNFPWLDLLVARGGLLFGFLSVIAFFLKVLFFLFLYIWLRGTLPRFRFDQLMNFGWKFLLPVAILNVVLTATVVFAISYFRA
jgi:NADH-quinone oxidoreductase subunit H